MPSDKSAKILIIEDDPKGLQFLGTILQDHNYLIYLANDGEEGFLRALKVMPDLIILDLLLPGIGGFELLTRLKKEETLKGIPVILITAKASDEDFEKGFSLGAADFLHKPFNTSELLSRVFTHLRNQLEKLDIERQLREMLQLFQFVGSELSSEIFGVREILDVAKNDVQEFIKNLPLVEGAVRKVQESIGLIQDFISLENRKQNWDISSVPLKNALELAEKEFIARFSSEIKVNYSKIPEKLCVWVHKPSFIQTVLPNLLMLAFSFSAEGSLLEFLVKEEKEWLILEIKNETTMGDTKKLQARQAMAENFRLSLIKKFIEAYGGEISSDFSVGKIKLSVSFRKGSSAEISL